MEIREIKLKDVILLDNSRTKSKKEEMAELMESIKMNGLLQPIGVREGERKGEYNLIFGYRRFEAVSKLGHKTIPAHILVENQDEDAAMFFYINNLVENLQRKDINCVELGRICWELKSKFNMTDAEIAVRVSVPKGRIKQALDTYNYVPDEYKGKVKTMTFGSNTKSAGNIPSSIATSITNIKRKYGLKQDDVRPLFEMARKGESLTNDKLNILMALMDGGLTLEDSVDGVEQIVVVRPSIPMFKDDFDKIKELLGGVNSIRELVYSNSKIPVRDPKIVLTRKNNAEKRRTILRKKEE
jgi:ParB/RepB/Spo0J family partition protein